MESNLVNRLIKKHKTFVKGLDQKQKKLFYILEFFILLNIILSPLYIITYQNVEFYDVNLVTAESSSGILNLLGIRSETTGEYGGVSLSVDGLPQMFISNSCSGFIPIFLIIGLLLALPESTLKRKLKYLLFFIPLVYIVNILRIVTTVWIGLNFGVETFDFFHTVLWSYAMIAIVLILWVYFIKKEKIKLTF